MLTTTQQAWTDGRPILDQLPQLGFQDNPVAAALTAYPDDTLTGWSELLQNLHTTLDPNLCDTSLLDYVAFLFGLSGEPYWDVKWSADVKRAILLQEHYLRKYKGTLGVIKTVLNIHGISYHLYTDGELIMPFAFPGAFGTGLMRFFILLPPTIPRTSTVWLEAVRTLRAYAPAYVFSMVAYQGFYLGLSPMGSPMFSSGMLPSIQTPTT